MALCRMFWLFLSTPSARRATIPLHMRFQRHPFLSTPSARRATTLPFKSEWRIAISIHALREEGDAGLRLAWKNADRFLSTPSARRATSALVYTFRLFAFLSTPSARRATAKPNACNLIRKRFLSTPSARRATVHPPRPDTAACNFYPRPPRGGRHLRGHSV